MISVSLTGMENPVIITSYLGRNQTVWNSLSVDEKLALPVIEVGRWNMNFL